MPKTALYASTLHILLQPPEGCVRGIRLNKTRQRLNLKKTRTASGSSPRPPATPDGPMAAVSDSQHLPASSTMPEKPNADDATTPSVPHSAMERDLVLSTRLKKIIARLNQSESGCCFSLVFRPETSLGKWIKQFWGAVGKDKGLDSMIDDLRLQDSTILAYYSIARAVGTSDAISSDSVKDRRRPLIETAHKAVSKPGVKIVEDMIVKACIVSRDDLTPWLKAKYDLKYKEMRNGFPLGDDRNRLDKVGAPNSVYKNSLGSFSFIEKHAVGDEWQLDSTNTATTVTTVTPHSNKDLDANKSLRSLVQGVIGYENNLYSVKREEGPSDFFTISQSLSLFPEARQYELGVETIWQRYIDLQSDERKPFDGVHIDDAEVDGRPLTVGIFTLFGHPTLFFRKPMSMNTMESKHFLAPATSKSPYVFTRSLAKTVGEQRSLSPDKFEGLYLHCSPTALENRKALTDFLPTLLVQGRLADFFAVLATGSIFERLVIPTVCSDGA